ncbi:hypothetical protein ADK67_33980 [Saccharothrix sp. NRRL B-16348]|nr:hypothetical protein ADK67_33980 [Saccharothrix sp. NRRL B-16348]
MQAGTITGNVHVYPGPGPSEAPSAHRGQYFTLGWTLGDQLPLMPGHAHEHITWSTFVEALLAVGFTQPEVATVLATKQQLSPDRSESSGRADRSVVLEAYAGALDDLHRQIERRADQDQHVWFMIGKLTGEIRMSRTFDEHGYTESTGRYSGSVYEAHATLASLVASVDLPPTARVALDGFLAAVENGVELKDLYNRADAVQRACTIGSL